MEAAVAGYAEGALKSSLGRLGSFLWSEALLVGTVRQDIQFIRDELLSMDAVLQDMIRSGHLNQQSSKAWMLQVLEVACDAELCTDEFKEKALKSRAKEVSERRSRYNTTFVPMEKQNPESTRVTDKRDTDLVQYNHLVAEGALVGIHTSDTYKICRKVATDDEFKMLVIVGPTGSGKTALARMVYRRRNHNFGKKIKRTLRFRTAAWVTVSDKPDMKRVLEEILRQVTESPLQGIKEYDVKRLQNKLQEKLANARYLIVLDSLWSVEHWQTIKDALPGTGLGRVVVTTRKENVAEECCRNIHDRARERCEMQPLLEEQLDKLIIQLLSNDRLERVHSKRWGKLRKAILHTCRMPLALKCICGALASVDMEFHWLLIMKDDLLSVCKRFTDQEDRTKQVLLKYCWSKYLPPWLQQCSQDLSNLPEHYAINRKKLMRRWIAKGFIKPRRGLSVEEVAESYFNELISRCIIEPESVHPSGNIQRCLINGVFKEFIALVPIPGTNPRDNQPVPDPKTVNPADNGQVPNYENQNPGSEQQVPNPETVNPADNGQVPKYENQNPGSEQQVPNPETVNPADNGQVPKYQNQNPGSEQQVPNPETVNPADNGQVPKYENQNPASEQQVPNPETVNPADNGQVPNYENQNPGSEQQVPNPETVNQADNGQVSNYENQNPGSEQQVPNPDPAVFELYNINLSAELDFVKEQLFSRKPELLTFLDLEGCKGLSNRELDKLCKFVQLRFLSLRNTDVNHLPEKIGKLKLLETLDIRQTKIKKVHRGIIGLDRLKHLLAGYVSKPERTTGANFVPCSRAIEVPIEIKEMRALQTLTHVNATQASEILHAMRELTQLKKLGLVIREEKLNSKPLCISIMMLSASLHSLSVCDEREGGSLDFLKYLCFPPQKLESLDLRGHLGRLPPWVANHIRLTKITLSHTQLGSDDLKLLGGIPSLLCLKLYSDSFRERALVLRKDDFNALRVLVVCCDAIRTISFEEGAAPSLEVFKWVLQNLITRNIHGIEKLPMLKDVSLIGSFDVGGQGLLVNLRKTLKNHENHTKSLALNFIEKEKWDNIEDETENETTTMCWSFISISLDKLRRIFLESINMVTKEITQASSTSS